MPLKTPKQYLESLKDGRVVYCMGEKVEDVTKNKYVWPNIEMCLHDYELADDPELKDLVFTKNEKGERINFCFVPIKSKEDLLRRREIIQRTFRGDKPIGGKLTGVDGLNGVTVACEQMDKYKGTNYSKRVAAYRKYLQDTDAALAMCMTDVKGDRGLHPSKQKDHKDYYLHIVDENKDGIVIRGAKAHISFAAACHEMMVLPCRAMTEADKDYAVSCGVSMNTKGITIISPAPEIPHAKKGDFDHPLGGGIGGDAVVVFDDVFVPNERVFLKGEWEFSAMQTYMFSNFHRMTADAYKYPLIEKFVGCAALIAEYNGIEKYGHVREKLTWLAQYAEITEALGRLACELCVSEPGSDLVYPKPMLSNLAKLYFAENNMTSIQHMMDLAGGIMATIPCEKDFKNPVTGPMLEKYLRGKADVPTESRMKAINLAKALCGEFEQISSVNAEGSIASQRLGIFVTAPFQEWKDLAKKMAGIP